MFIFVLQTIWLYIGELAGKDLDAEVILKFLLYFSPKLVPLVLPLTILLTSIMTFGSFAENYEFAAMKSSGISLGRAMRSLTVFIVFISLVAFFFANNVIPAAEFKSINLRKNIAQLKPAMAITEGTFNDIGTFNIKVDEKTGENDQYLNNVIIHQKKKSGGNNTVIKAKEGELVGSTDSDVLSLILKEGNYYDEVEPSDYKKRKRKPFTKSYFDEYVINIDLSDFNNVDLEDETYSSAHGMLKISELNESIDSFSVSYNTRMDAFSKNMYNRTGISNLNNNYKAKDTVVTNNELLSYFDTYDAAQISNLALGTVNSALAHLGMKKQEFKTNIKQINKFEIALHEKYALSIACIVLFFVGAPLGAIIRKGGIGLPIVVAILLFLTYHFIGIFAKNSAENGSIPAFIATWLSTWIMLPLGVYLTYRATTDQGLFVFDNFIAPIKKLFKKAGLFKDKSKTE